MDADQILDQLEAIKSDSDFYGRSSELAEGWAALGLGLESVEPILRFMESHPGIDYGSPGGLVQFVERFYGHGYERPRLEAVVRHEARPSPSSRAALAVAIAVESPTLGRPP